MQWTDHAILLSARKHGETSAVARVFSREHGLYGGVIRGASSKKKRGILAAGNIVSATWNARLSEQLGTLTCELLEAHAAFIMQDAAKLTALSSACALMESALPERHPYAQLYNVFAAFLTTLQNSEDWPESYVKLELEILAETGFGLDLATCAATGTTEDLIYVSPKSGRAVSQEAGEPYKDKMLPLPAFLLNPLPRSVGKEREETLAGLRLTGYFLEHWLLTPHHRKLPAARKRLIETLKATHG